MLKRFIKYYGPHKKMFALDMLASFLISVIGMCYPIITREMLNTFIPEKQVDMIVFWGIGLFVYILLECYLDTLYNTTDMW